MRSENVQKGTEKVDNTSRRFVTDFFIKLFNISCLEDEVAEKESSFHSLKLIELVMFVVGMYIDEGFSCMAAT